MIKEKNLHKGEIYYLLSFYDRELKVMKIRTYEYIGLRKKQNEVEYVFKEPLFNSKYTNKYRDKSRIAGILVANSDITAHLYDIDGLIEILQRVKCGELAKRGILDSE
ncbi:MAG: hypothetical protein HQK86_15160 [Nitrospinae bacterium]|nr:hypothetical protein [Nitrospinota bacterium]